jgi:hypothetical protein
MSVIQDMRLDDPDKGREEFYEFQIQNPEYQSVSG